MKLNNFNLVEITKSEMLETNGGSKPGKLIRGGIWGYIITGIIDNWDDIKQGFNEGREAAR